MILLTGGARSGKSALAIDLVRDWRANVTYIATAVAGDTEMERRIAAHRRRRPASWSVVEEAVRLSDAIGRVEPASALIIDCLTLWVSNLIETHADDEIRELGREAAEAAADRQALTVVVSNDVGSGVVPASPLGRRFRDLQGEINQVWARRCSDVYLVVAGRAIATTPGKSILA